MSPSAPDAARFREVLGSVPTAVVVVTARRGEQAVGLSVGSFVSISLDPPLVGMFIAETSTSWPQIEAVGSFTVNVLADEQGALARQFAASGADKFADLEWTASGLGHPVLAGCQAYLDCHVDRVEQVGDHLLVVGRVDSLAADPGRSPLVFHRGTMARLERADS